MMILYSRRDVFTHLDARNVPRLQPDQRAAAVAVEHARRPAPRALHPAGALRGIQRGVRRDTQAAQSAALLIRHHYDKQTHVCTTHRKHYRAAGNRKRSGGWFPSNRRDADV